MAGPAPKQRMTVGEFLVYDDGTDMRYELVDDELVVMNPLAEPHVRLAMNVQEALTQQLRRACSAYMGGGVWLSEDDRTWREPDVFVSCVAGKGFTRAPDYSWKSRLRRPRRTTARASSTSIAVPPAFGRCFWSGKRRGGSRFANATTNARWFAI